MDGSWDNMNYRKNWKYKYMVGQHELSQKPRVRLYGRTTWTPQKPRVRLHDGTTRTLTKAESKTTWWDNTRYNNVTLLHWSTSGPRVTGVIVSRTTQTLRTKAGSKTTWSDNTNIATKDESMTNGWTTWTSESTKAASKNIWSETKGLSQNT